MKKFLSATVATAAATVGAIAAAVALATSAVAAPLNTRGIPADAAGVIHVDYEAFAKTPFSAPTQKVASTMPTHGPGMMLDPAIVNAEFEKFKKETGINPQTDLYSVTIGILPPVKSSQKGPHASSGVVMVLRGKYSAQKLLAYWKKVDEDKKFADRAVTIGRHKVYVDDETFISFVDNSTIVFGSIIKDKSKTAPAVSPKDRAKAALAAFDGTAKSYTPPASLLTLGRQVGTPTLLGFCNLNVFQFPPANPNDAEDIPVPSNVQLALGLTGSTSKLRLVTKSAKAADAQVLQTKAQAGVAFAQMLLLQLNQAAAKDNSAATPAAKAEQKLQKSAAVEIPKLLGKIKFTTNATNVELALDYPSSALLALFNDASAYSEAKTKEAAAARK